MISNELVMVFFRRILRGWKALTTANTAKDMKAEDFLVFAPGDSICNDPQGAASRSRHCEARGAVAIQNDRDREGTGLLRFARNDGRGVSYCISDDFG
jgi:hypothetical protein